MCISSDDAATRARLPFWAHQLVEYALALFLGELALHASGRAATGLLAAAAGLALLAAVSDGPLGAVRVVSRTMHRLLDVMVAAIVAASPLVVSHSIAAIAVSEGLAIVLLRLVFMTSYRPPRPREAGRGGDVAARAARHTGRAVGRAARHVPSEGAAAEKALIAGARGLGHLTNRIKARRRP